MKSFVTCGSSLIFLSQFSYGQQPRTFASSGATLTTYGKTFTGGGKIIAGSSPAKTVVSGTTALTFSPGAGLVQLPGVTAGNTDFRFFDGINPSGTRIALFDSRGTGGTAIFDLTTNTRSSPPPVPVPIGPINTVSAVSVFDIADNGDFSGAITDGSGTRHGCHYSVATGTYTLLGNVPNSTNDPSTNPVAISADGTSIAGYERVGTFDGAFLWTVSGGFTLLEAPANASTPSGDIRDISPNGRFIVGGGRDSEARGGGSTAMRWDRGQALGFPTGLGLARATEFLSSDAFTVNNAGVTGGFYRRPGGQNTDSRAAVWLPDGSLRDLNDHLVSTYGFDPEAFHMAIITSISEDGKTLAGSITGSDFIPEGFVLTLPDPVGGGTVNPPTAAETALDDYLGGFNVPTDKRGASDDPDVDGIANLMEFALGLNPNAHSVLPLTSVSGNTASITYVQANPDHVTYSVTFSLDLGSVSPFVPDAVNQGTPAIDGITTASVSTTGKLNGFLRVEASLRP